MQGLSKREGANMIIDINGVSYELINPLTKKGQDLLSAYKFFVSYRGYRSIETAYSKPSTAKIKAYERWCNELVTIGCSGITVLGVSSWLFSMGAKHERGLFYITPNHNYFIADTVGTYQALKGGDKF